MANEDSTQPPNIVLIMMDQLGSADLGSYGALDISTPNLDRLADEGVVLDQCYSNGAVCTPSRAALMTGMYPAKINMEGNLDSSDPSTGLPVGLETIADTLKEAGYRTGLFGKWHIGGEAHQRPLACGFDEFFGFLNFAIDYYSHTTPDGRPALFDGDNLVEVDGYLTDLIADRSVSFIQQSEGDPFFAFVSFNAPLPPRQIPSLVGAQQKVSSWSGHDRDPYRQVVEYADSAIGRVLDAIERSGQGDDTLVIFVTDHGGISGLADNGDRFHGFGTLWEGGIKVPCILRWPELIPAGVRSEQLTMGTDIAVSILSAANISLDGSHDGQNILGLLSDQTVVNDRTHFWRISNSGRQQAAARRGNWKYLRDGDRTDLGRSGPTSTWMLFDVTTDPGERENLAGVHPTIVEDLQQELARWESEMATYTV